MAIINGTGGDDDLEGFSGSDTIRGRAGNDYIVDALGGDDVIHGNRGDDEIYVIREEDASVSTVRVYGGADNDFIVWDSLNASKGILNGGDGDDVIDIHANVGAVVITTGAGADVIVFDDVEMPGGEPLLGKITIKDFQADDTIAWSVFLSNYLTDWEGDNPFATGHAKLVQVGDNVVLQLNKDGVGNDWITIARFQNTQVEDFTAEQLEGFDPDGSAPIGRTINGTSGDDSIWGTVGDDIIYGRGGSDFIYDSIGDDVVYGGAGDDFLFGSLGNDILRGGSGDDVLIRVDQNGANSGNDVLHGNGGDDTFFFITEQQSPKSVTKAFGGVGSDTFNVVALNTKSTIRLNGGADDDAFIIIASLGKLFITTGEGSDLIDLDALVLDEASPITVTDFQAGAGGDILAITGLVSQFTGVDGDTDLFEDGYVQVIQDGADTRIQYDLDGGGDGFVDLLVLQNVEASTLTEDNFGVYP